MFFILDKIIWAKKMHKLNLFLLLNLNCNTEIKLERFSACILGFKYSQWCWNKQKGRQLAQNKTLLDWEHNFNRIEDSRD